MSSSATSATPRKCRTSVYEVGKAHGFEPLRDWFKALYEVLFGQTAGPRFGSFAALFGCVETAALIRRALAGEFDRRRMKHALALLLALAASPALAATPYELYVAGRYEDAMKAGTAAGTAAGYTVAARAALADATTRSSPCLDCLRRAEDFARRAIAADPHKPEGHIYLAVAMGYEARIVGPVWARAHNYPGHAKDELDAALAIDPKSPWALGALGGWNVEIVRTGRRHLGRLVLRRIGR